jgi:uncharacterized protein YbjT (DUF2867 family)
MPKARTTPTKGRPRWKNPDPERAAATINHLAEDMPELVTREDAMEAAVYWRNRFEKASRAIREAKTTVLAEGLKAATTATSVAGRLQEGTLG